MGVWLWMVWITPLNQSPEIRLLGYFEGGNCRHQGRILSDRSHLRMTPCIMSTVSGPWGWSDAGI